MISPEEFFREEGELSRLHPRYDYRPQQEEMAEAVRKTIEKEGILMAEAGTGVGKSLAYLYPFVLHALQTGKKVAISTGTKTLQRQLIEQDIPFSPRQPVLILRQNSAWGLIIISVSIAWRKPENRGFSRARSRPGSIRRLPTGRWRRIPVSA